MLPYVRHSGVLHDEDRAQRFLTGMYRSTMRLYAVVGARPGVSIALRDRVVGGDTTVHAPESSRSFGVAT